MALFRARSEGLSTRCLSSTSKGTSAIQSSSAYPLADALLYSLAIFGAQDSAARLSAGSPGRFASVVDGYKPRASLTDSQFDCALLFNLYLHLSRPHLTLARHKHICTMADVESGRTENGAAPNLVKESAEAYILTDEKFMQDADLEVRRGALSLL